MIVITPTTAAALALHAAEGAWVMFAQVVPPGIYGPIKIEGMLGRHLSTRLNAIARESPYEVQLIGLMISPSPADHVAQFMEDFSGSHIHDGWFQNTTDLYNTIIHCGQAALRELIGEVHPGSFDQDQLVDIERMAEIIGISTVTLRRWIAAERIPFLRAGKQYRFVPREVIASLERER